MFSHVFSLTSRKIFKFLAHHHAFKFKGAIVTKYLTLNLLGNVTSFMGDPFTYKSCDTIYLFRSRLTIIQSYVIRNSWMNTNDPFTPFDINNESCLCDVITCTPRLPVAARAFSARALENPICRRVSRAEELPWHLEADSVELAESTDGGRCLRGGSGADDDAMLFTLSHTEKLNVFRFT